MAQIITSRGDVILFDDSDAPIVINHIWFACKRRNRIYAKTNIVKENGRKSTAYMHKIITGWPEVDHRDGDGLNNQRNNLRPATRRQNLQNKRTFPHSSKYKGVSKVRRNGEWRGMFQVHIRANAQNLFLGTFKDEVAAAAAYDEAAKKYFGEFARTNFQ